MWCRTIPVSCWCSITPAKNDTLVLFIGGRGLWQFVTAEQVEQITAQNMETAWNVARQGGYEDVSLLATQEFEQIFVLKK